MRLSDDVACHNLRANFGKQRYSIGGAPFRGAPYERQTEKSVRVCRRRVSLPDACIEIGQHGAAPAEKRETVVR